MKKHHWFDFVEYLSLIGLGAGSVLSLVSKQVLFTSAPLSFALLIGFANRRRVEQAQEQKLVDSLSMLDQKLTKSIKIIDQRVHALPTPEMIGDVRQSILRHGREEIERLSAQIVKVRQEVEERLSSFSQENLDATRQEITQLRREYSEVYQSLTNMSAALDQAVQADQMDQVEQAIATLNQQSENLQATLKSLDEYNKHTMSNLQEQVNQVNRQLKSLPPPVDAAPLKRDLSELVRVVADLVPKRDLNNLVAELRSVQQWQESRTQMDQGLRQDIQAVRQRLHSLPDVPQLRSQLEESFTQEIRAINRQLRTLHSSPEMRTRIEEVLKEELATLYQQLAERSSNNPYDLVFDLASDHQPTGNLAAIAGSRLVLEEALETSQERLILIWPWSDYTELDHSLLSQMETYLQQRRLLEVGWCHLSDRHSDRFLSKINRRWAINPLSQGQLQGTLKRLLALKRRYPDYFRFKILGMVENFLISDSSFAVLGIQERLKTQTVLQNVDLKLRTTDAQVIQQLTQRFDQDHPADEDTEAYWNRAVTRYDLGDKAGAVQDLNSILAVTPDEAEVYNLRAIIRYDQKDSLGAIEDLNQALRICPSLISAYCNRGYIRSECGDYAAAIADFDVALDEAPDSAIAFFYRAVAYQKLEQPIEALRDYSAAIDHAPDSAPAYYERGLIYRMLGCLTEAIADFESAAQFFTDKGQAKNAQVAERQGSEVSALAETHPSMSPPLLPPMQHPAHGAKLDETSDSDEASEEDVQAERQLSYEYEADPKPHQTGVSAIGDSRDVPLAEADWEKDSLERNSTMSGLTGGDRPTNTADSGSTPDPTRNIDKKHEDDYSRNGTAACPDSLNGTASSIQSASEDSPLGSSFNEAFGNAFGQAFGDVTFDDTVDKADGDEAESTASSERMSDENSMKYPNNPLDADIPDYVLTDVFIPDMNHLEGLPTDETLIEPRLPEEDPEASLDAVEPDAASASAPLMQPAEPLAGEDDEVILLPPALSTASDSFSNVEINAEPVSAPRAIATPDDETLIEPLPTSSAPTFETFDLFADGDDDDDPLAGASQEDGLSHAVEKSADEVLADEADGNPPALAWVDQFSEDDDSAFQEATQASEALHSSVVFDLGQNVSSTEETAILEVFGDSAETSTDDPANQASVDESLSDEPLDEPMTAQDAVPEEMPFQDDDFATTEDLSAIFGDHPSILMESTSPDTDLPNTAADLSAGETSEDLAAAFADADSSESPVFLPAVEEPDPQQADPQEPEVDESEVKEPGRPDVDSSGTSSESWRGASAREGLDEPSVIGVIEDDNTIGNLFWQSTAAEPAPDAEAIAESDGIEQASLEEELSPSPDEGPDIDEGLSKKEAIATPNPLEDATFEDWGIEEDAETHSSAVPTDTTAESDAQASTAIEAESDVRGDRSAQLSPFQNDYQETDTLVDWFAAFEDDEPVSLVADSSAQENAVSDASLSSNSASDNLALSDSQSASQASFSPRRRPRDTDDTEQIGIQTLADFMSALQSASDSQSNEAIANRSEPRRETRTPNQNQSSSTSSDKNAEQEESEPPRMLDDLFLGSPELDEPERDDQAMSRREFNR